MWQAGIVRKGVTFVTVMALAAGVSVAWGDDYPRKDEPPQPTAHSNNSIGLPDLSEQSFTYSDDVVIWVEHTSYGTYAPSLVPGRQTDWLSYLVSLLARLLGWVI